MAYSFKELRKFGNKLSNAPIVSLKDYQETFKKMFDERLRKLDTFPINKEMQDKLMQKIADEVDMELGGMFRIKEIEDANV